MEAVGRVDAAGGAAGGPGADREGGPGGVPEGEPGDTASDSQASRPTAPSSSEAPAEDEGAVPETYLGTWEGDAYALSGQLPAGTFRVTLRQAAVGQPLGTFRSTDLIGGVCEDALVLKKVTKKQLTATSIADKNNPGVCTTGEHEVRLIPVGKELRYETDNADAGDPVARMAKTG